MSIKQKIAELFFHVKSYPIETCEVIVLLVLCAFAVFILMPFEVLPLAFNFGVFATRVVLGLAMLYAGLPLIYMRYKYGIEKYTFLYGRKRRKRLFWVTQIWFYFFLLRLLTQPFFPPIFLLYLGLMLISLVFYVRLGK